jgi:hypothetical protein
VENGHKKENPMRKHAPVSNTSSTVTMFFLAVWLTGCLVSASQATPEVRTGAGSILDSHVPQIAFALEEIRLAADGDAKLPVIEFEMDAGGLGPQGYRIERRADGALRVAGGDAIGAMYGGLEVAEALRLRRLAELDDRPRRPHVERRGIKFNIPLDLRTPSYSDASDSFQANIPEVWDMDFWRELLDQMARHRYNVLSLWSLHPFPSIVRVPEYPDVALDDVWRTKATLDSTFSLTGSDMVRPAMLADHEIVKRITIDQKIDFWRRVMQHAHDRGIEVYWFTWNIFVWGADGKYGITAAQDNPATIAYFRASVRETVRTYPLLAGMGITAGEQMKGGQVSPTREQWLWQTYGQGIRDALAEQPDRPFRLIHRFHQTALDEILHEFRDFPATLDVSFKYSIAHMYSMPDPPFLQAALPRMPPELRTWLTVRNDDIYSFRWGDPDFARDYVRAMPGPERVAGFYMGPDGYCWGREFIDRDAESPRRLVMQKQWYSFLLWGRLSYDPSVPNEHFRRVLGSRFPHADAQRLFDAVQQSSRIIPLVNRFYWENFDFQWFPEACISHPTRAKGFHTVRHFMTGRTMSGSGLMNIRQYVDSLLDDKPIPPMVARGEGGVVLEHLRGQVPDVTPLQVIEQLRTYAQAALDHAAVLKPGEDGELGATLGDTIAMAHLGRYYAAKIEGAVNLYRFDRTAREDDRKAAVANLEQALEHWRDYVNVAARQYQPQLLNRVGHVDLREITAHVERDIALARDWRPGSLAEKQSQR